ncbi:hypothetical protein ACQKP0_15000 [Heyndrickxia sp. NPDC080065]|uniref:hypothetical protein n=1 Tax=Heyndrickxia sp. NPDC080065 TaxID=3390568 RepID=UPI003D001CDE
MRGRKTEITLRNGIEGKTCTGILCRDNEDSWKPLTHFLMDNSRGRLRHECKECRHFNNDIFRENNYFHVLAYRMSRSRNGCDENINWEQKLEEIWEQQEGKCAITGLQMNFKKGSALRVSPDRIDNNIGYFDGNVRLVGWKFNNIRGSRPAKDSDPIIKKGVEEIQKELLQQLWQKIFKNTTRFGRT